MTKEVARIEKGGTLKTDGVLLERTSKDFHAKLVHHVSLDSDVASDTVKTSVRTIAKEVAPNAYNMLDACGMDWRDPDSWTDNRKNSTRTTKYIEELDCLEFTGYHEVTFKGMFPIFTDLNFFIEFEVQVVNGDSSDNNKGRIYLGGRHADEHGNIKPGGSQNHSGSYWDYLGVTGVLLPESDKWVGYKNAGNSGNARIGVSATNTSTWTNANTDVFFQPIILASHNQSDDTIMRIRNLRMWYEEPTKKTANNGITTQLASSDRVNLCRRSFTEGTDGWGGHKSVNEKYIMPDGSMGMHSRILRDYSKPSGGATLPQFTGNVAVTPNTVYTFAAMVKHTDWSHPNSNLIYVRQFKSDNTTTDADRTLSGYNASRRVYMGNGWYMIWYTWRTAADAAKCRVDSYQYREGSEFWGGLPTLVKGYSALLLPQGNATEYNRQLRIPVRELTDFTVFGSFINSNEVKDTISYSDGLANQAALCALVDQNGHKCYYRYYKAQNNRAYPFIDPDPNTEWTTTSSGHSHQYVTLDNATEYYWTFKRVNGGNLIFTFYAPSGNVVSRQQLASNAIGSPRLQEVILGHESNPWDAQHKFVSVYNGDLSDGEIKHLIKTKMNVDGGGIRDEISEEQSISGLYDVDMSAHENKKFGTGYATRAPKPNLLPIVSVVNGWSDVRRHTEMVDTPYGMGYKYMSGAMTAHWGGADGIHGTDDDTGIYGYTIYQTPAGTFSGGDRAYFSSWVYVSEDCNCDNVRISFETHSGGSTFYNMDKKGTWQFVKIRSVINAGHTQARVLLYPSGRAGTWGEVGPHFDGFIIFAGTALTQDAAGDLMPYVGNPADTGHRGMKFNLHNDYHIDFSRDWTITYEMMPMSGHDNRTNGYLIDSMGSNPNSIGGGYIWWGKSVNETDRIYDSTPNDPNPNYWHHWRRVTVTYDKSANKMYMYDHGYDGLRVRSVSVNISKPDHFVSQYGYDLLLGGHNNGMIQGAIYRDLKVGQVYKSQAEVETYYSQGLNISKESVNVREFVECKL